MSPALPPDHDDDCRRPDRHAAHCARLWAGWRCPPGAWSCSSRWSRRLAVPDALHHTGHLPLYGEAAADEAARNAGPAHLGRNDALKATLSHYYSRWAGPTVIG